MDLFLAETWPEVPKDLRPKELPHQGQIAEGELSKFREKGYAPVDVRLMSGQHAVRLWLEGGRLGTVQVDRQQLAVLELEAKVFGLTQSNRRAGLESTKPIAKETEEAVFDFFKEKRQYKGDAGLPDPKKIKRKTGRKKWSTDKKQRTLGGTALQNVLKAKERASGQS